MHPQSTSDLIFVADQGCLSSPVPVASRTERAERQTATVPAVSAEFAFAPSSSKFGRPAASTQSGRRWHGHSIEFFCSPSAHCTALHCTALHVRLRCVARSLRRRNSLAAQRRTALQALTVLVGVFAEERGHGDEHLKEERRVEASGVKWSEVEWKDGSGWSMESQWKWQNGEGGAAGGPAGAIGRRRSSSGKAAWVTSERSGVEPTGQISDQGR